MVLAEAEKLLDQQRPVPGEGDLRDFEWHYWNRLCHADVRKMRLGDTPLLTAAFSPDGTKIAGLLLPRNDAAPAGAHLTYYGGRVVSNLQVVEVLWGTGPAGSGNGSASPA